MKTINGRFMNYFGGILGVTGLLMPFQGQAAKLDPNSKVVMAQIEDLYIPTGFDTNDTIEIAVSGTVPSPCYSKREVKVEQAGQKIAIQITATKRTITSTPSGNSLCPMVLVPFLEVVNLGSLHGGSYEITVNGKALEQQDGQAVKGLLAVTDASQLEIDDYLYALTEYVEKDLRTNRYYINGYNYSDCLALKEVKYVTNEKNVVSVMPVMEQTRDFCPRKMVPFKYEINPPLDTLKSQRVLIHVRSADGKSVNSLVDRQ